MSSSRSVRRGFSRDLQQARLPVGQLIAIGFALLAPTAYAVECGSIIEQRAVAQLEQSLGTAQNLLLRRTTSLFNESLTLQTPPQAEVALRRNQEINDERDHLEIILADGERVSAALKTVSALVDVRDAMVDKRDRVLVEGYLSTSARHAGRIAKRVYGRLTNAVIGDADRTSSAAEAAKVRDAVGAVSTELGNCDSQRIPSKWKSRVKKG